MSAKVSPNSQIIFSSSSGNRFTNALEDYLDKKRKGVATIDSKVPDQLSNKLSSSSDFLSRTDPRSLKNYSGYLTGFTYDKRGRFVSNLDDVFASTNTINKASS